MTARRNIFYKKNTYRTLRHFYNKNIVEIILRYCNDAKHQILMNKLKFAAVLKNIKSIRSPYDDLIA